MKVKCYAFQIYNWGKAFLIPYVTWPMPLSQYRNACALTKIGQYQKQRLPQPFQVQIYISSYEFKIGRWKHNFLCSSFADTVLNMQNITCKPWMLKVHTETQSLTNAIQLKWTKTLSWQNHSKNAICTTFNTQSTNIEVVLKLPNKES